MTKDEALKLGIEALENGNDNMSFLQREKAIDTIKEVLAQPTSKPLTDAQIDDLVETHCTSYDAYCLLYTFTTADLRELIEAAYGIKD